MKLQHPLFTATFLLPSAHAWGNMGHETIAYIAQNFVKPATATYCQDILGDSSTSYLATVSTWADSYRYTSAGAFSQPYHFIDAQDSPPSSCNVNYARDCGTSGCVVSAVEEYVSSGVFIPSTPIYPPHLSLSIQPNTSC
jgi:S1/P1 Nuclease